MLQLIYNFIKKIMTRKDSRYEIQNAWMDRPDPRDWYYEDIVWSHQPVQEETILLGNTVAIQNQSLPNNPSTKMACWSYWIWHCNNVIWEAKKWIDYVYCNELRAKFVEAYREEYKVKWNIDPVVHGSYLQDQLNFWIEKKIIAWYWMINKTRVSFINALKKWNLIYTWSNRINRKETFANRNIVVPGTWSWHAFCIDWVKWEYFRCRDSYWPHVRDNWRFRIHQDHLHVLYTCYAIFWLEQQEIVDWFLKKIEKAKKDVLQRWKAPTTVIEKIVWNNRELLKKDNL